MKLAAAPHTALSGLRPPPSMQAAVELQRAVQQVTEILREKEDRFQQLQLEVTRLSDEIGRFRTQEASRLPRCGSTDIKREFHEIYMSQ